MSKRPRQPSSEPTKPASKPAKAAAKPAAKPAGAASPAKPAGAANPAKKATKSSPAKSADPSSPAPKSTATATDATKSSPAKSADPSSPASKATATATDATKSSPAESADTSSPAPKSTATDATKSSPAKTGVSARAVRKATEERLAEASAAAKPPTRPVGRVRKAVETVLAFAEKLGEEVLERVTGEPEPVPPTAYLSAPPPVADEPVAPATAYLGDAPVPEDSPAAYLGDAPVPEDSPAAYLGDAPVPEDSPAAHLGDAPVPEDIFTGYVVEPVPVPEDSPATASLGEPPVPEDSPADYRDPDALAERSAPIPAAYLAVPAPPSPVVYLADLPAAAAAPVDPAMTDFDAHLMAEGTHLRLFEKLGAHRLAAGGVHFAVWAPNARSVSVIGEWNGWDPGREPLRRGGNGVWAGVAPNAAVGMLYKYRVVGMRGEELDKADPCAQATELPPQTASVIADATHAWGDAAWLAARAERQAVNAPMSVYEVHLGSWMRGPDDEFLGYREVAPRLIEHVRALGFTHVEFMPLTEHPFYGSWGYQASAYFAPSARFGAPQDLMYLIDQLHQAGIGVILDWVPAHFPADAHGLARFDGSRLYEHYDWRRGVHPDWNTLIFNLSRPEVQSFLLSSAMLWIERFHVDGIRVDAVASMLYLDYSRGPGQWAPNEHGGRENLESVAFLRALNRVIHEHHPGVITIAEDSTAWPGVTAPADRGGLGFDLKWDMGWMHDTLRYLGRDPLARKHHHDELTFRMMYVYNERFMLPLSHDEVVHGKGSLVRKMHGDAPLKFAGLRLLYAYMFTAPGQKLLFMGDEFAQIREWNHDRALDWPLRQLPLHAGLERWVRTVAHLYRDDPALHELDHEPAGFEWLIVDDRDRSLVAYLRLPRTGPAMLVALNFTPMTWADQQVRLPAAGRWNLLARSDAPEYSDDPGAAPIALADHLDPTPDADPERGHTLTLTVPGTSALLYRGPDAAVLRAAAERARSERIAREAAAAAAAAKAEAEAAEKAKAEAAKAEEAAKANAAARAGEAAATNATTDTAATAATAEPATTRAPDSSEPAPRRSAAKDPEPGSTPPIGVGER